VSDTGSPEPSMIQSFTVPFGAKYLTGMVINVPPYETCSLIKKNILRQSKISVDMNSIFMKLCHMTNVT
jgi:hypothetical protein